MKIKNRELRSVLLGFVFVSLLSCVLGCKESTERNAVYYWRTELRLDSAERAFLKRHHISRIYCRYFDVVMGSSEINGEDPVPNATITFTDTLPSDIEVVPTVFITEDCMHQPHKGLAEKLVKRIIQMNETHDIGPVREIQIDCDYTARSRRLYYDFLKEVKKELESQSSKLQSSNLKSQVSTTIRLHQLSMPAPPVDCGVLMLYNTGDPMKFYERNPILDIRDVAPYLPHLSSYKLPLAAAYPVFLWQRTLHGTNLEHQADISEILRVKEAVEHERPQLSQEIITYHLDKENIERYTPEDYETIYRH